MVYYSFSFNCELIGGMTKYTTINLSISNYNSLLDAN